MEDSIMYWNIAVIALVILVLFFINNYKFIFDFQEPLIAKRLSIDLSSIEDSM